MIGGAVGAAILGGTSGVLVGMGIGSAVAPIIGTLIGAVVGMLVGFFIDLFASDDSAVKVRAYYAAIIGGLAGYVPDYENGNDARTLNLSSKQGAVGVLNTILDRYIKIMNETYFSSPDILPYVAKEAAIKYQKVDGYTQMIINNEDKIISINTAVKKLGEIKNGIGILNQDYAVQDSNYEDKLKEYIDAFGRISSDMVNGADIASADSILKQIIDEKNYIYNNLLKGPNGCEAELMKPQKKFPSAGNTGGFEGYNWNMFDAISVKRATYPFTILYDYNTFITPGDSLPDPWNRGYANKTPDAGSSMYRNGDYKFGPGFLSFIFFSAEGTSGSGPNKYFRRGPQRLFISDLVPQKWDPGESAGNTWRAIGNRDTWNDEKPGSFETTIGIY